MGGWAFLCHNAVGYSRLCEPSGLVAHVRLVPFILCMMDHIDVQGELQSSILFWAVPLLRDTKLAAPSKSRATANPPCVTACMAMMTASCSTSVLLVNRRTYCDCNREVLSLQVLQLFCTCTSEAARNAAGGQDAKQSCCMCMSWRPDAEYPPKAASSVRKLNRRSPSLNYQVANHKQHPRQAPLTVIG